MASARCVRPQELVAAAIDHVALEGRDGVAVAELMDAVDPQRDARMRRQVWLLLRRQHARGVLQFFHVVSSAPASGSAGKKRKRPTGEHGSPTRRAVHEWPNGERKPGLGDEARDNKDVSMADGEHTRMSDDRPAPTHIATENGGHEAGAGAAGAGAEATADTQLAPATAIPTAASAVRREPVVDAEAIAYEDACPPSLIARRKRLFVVACEELRLRALNIPRKAILAEFGDDHLRILEAVGRTRSLGITIPALCDVFGSASSVKKVHNSLDTLISYNLVVKRMMIVAKPTMRRLNIVHLPRFAASFVPDMYDGSAEFESDEQCKKILVSAAETYLKELPTNSAVLYDLGRDLGFQKRHLEVLKSHIIQESKREDSFHLELFQAVLQPPKKGNAIEPKILNCVRYRAPSKDKAKSGQSQGMTLEMGLLHQIYGVIEENGDSGTTIIDLRNRMVLPGNKLPYKLVSILAGTYGLRAEAIILGKNKAFKLYPMLSDMRKASSDQPRMEDDDADEEGEITVIQSEPNGWTSSKLDETRYKRIVTDPEQREELFSVRANLALKVALGGGIEVEGTRKRRRDHIMERLETEKIISISSLRASMFLMEKKHASNDTSANDGTTSNAHIGMVDTRSVSRIAAELEEEGFLRLFQLPLPPRNVSTKFRTLRCVVWPGFENDKEFIEDYLKNYGRDERLRRIHQNVDKNEVVRLRAIDSDNEDVPGFSLFRRNRKRPRVDDARLSPVATPPRSITQVSTEPTEISYRVRRFVGQQKTKIHSQQYRRLGFAYGVMFRCKQFHQFLWSFLHEHPELHLRDEEIDVSLDDADDFSTVRHQSFNGCLDGEKRAKAISRGIVFSRETVLHRMPVYLYIQSFSGGSVLTASEFALVDYAVKNRLGFDSLPPSVCAKVWAHESGRTSKVLGTLTDLKLIVPHKIGMKNLIKILRSGYTDDRDNILAQALKDNALGGLFRLRSSIRVLLDDRHSTVPDSDIGKGDNDSINSLSAIKLVGTTERKFSFGRILPLKHTLLVHEDVDRYWETLEGLCVERMVMEVRNPKPNEPVVCEVPLPVKTRARRMFRVLGWISRSQKPTPKIEGDTKAIKSTGIVSRAIRASRRRGPAVKKKLKSKKKHATQINGTHTGTSENHSARRRSSSIVTNLSEFGEEEDSELFLWSDEDERQLVDYFIENCRSRWQILIPQGLQRDSETVAYRVPWLSRSGFGLVSIARKLCKRKIDVKKRLKEKLAEPDAKLLLEAAKREMTLALNPSGRFDEEAAIFESSRLTALFRRAVMMIVSPQEEYHPIVAEELISFWNAEEIRLVWRYLWLKNWIVRATERERIRGYSTSQKLQDFLKFTTLSYPLVLFQQAAEQEAMVSSTIEEVVGTNDLMITRSNSQSDLSFEAEFPANATPGQCALELGCHVMGLCSLVAIHSPITEENDGDTNASPNKDDQERTAAMLRKRTLRFLNYKSQKEGTGFAAHLSKRLSFKNPSILTENWHVETRMSGVSLDFPCERRKFEAFSTSHHEEERYRPAKKAKFTHRRLSAVVEQIVRESGEEGVTIEDVVTRMCRNGDAVDISLVKFCAENLVEKGVLICVNAYFAQRYITKDFGDFWLLRPYSIIPDDTKSIGRVVFEGEKDLLSFPWLKMDGSTNLRFLYSIQRKILSFVLISPGVTEETVCRRLDKLLTLQDTREALALLVEDGLLYTRATRSATTPLRSTSTKRLFGKKQRLLTPSIELLTVPSNRVLNVDRVKYTIHYFPHVECIQRFGSIVQDYQNEVADLPRG